MGIIGVLVAMLLPAVNQAVIVVRNAACKGRISQIEAGLANFKNDWGVYPPSDKDDDDADTLQQACPGSKTGGKDLLAVALVGPTSDGKGWGRPVENHALPFGGTSESDTYGPYYKGEFYWTGGGAYIPDAFPSPRRPILYYRFDRGEATYHFDDNPTGNINEGFQNESHFNLSAKYEAPDGTERWQRKGYLLICAGHDRMYGWIEDTDPPQAATSRTHIVEGTALCDDVTNFD